MARGFLLLEGVFWAFTSCCFMLAVASLFWLYAGLRPDGAWSLFFPQSG